MEALIGALYLDAGLDPARTAIRKALGRPGEGRGVGSAAAPQIGAAGMGRGEQPAHPRL